MPRPRYTLKQAVALIVIACFSFTPKPDIMYFYVYILYSRSLYRYYTGYTHDIISRQGKHNGGATPSNQPGIPLEMVYTESFQNKHDAIVREREIKDKKSRIYIENLIKTHQG